MLLMESMELRGVRGDQNGTDSNHPEFSRIEGGLVFVLSGKHWDRSIKMGVASFFMEL